jgi:hypothetical protein
MDNFGRSVGEFPYVNVCKTEFENPSTILYRSYGFFWFLIFDNHDCKYTKTRIHYLVPVRVLVTLLNMNVWFRVQRYITTVNMCIDTKHK